MIPNSRPRRPHEPQLWPYCFFPGLSSEGEKRRIIAGTGKFVISSGTGLIPFHQDNPDRQEKSQWGLFLRLNGSKSRQISCDARLRPERADFLSNFA